MRKTLFGMLVGVAIGVTLTAGVRVARGDSSESNPLTAWVPDMDQIFNMALQNVFDSAGEEFTDPELKAFYDRLTGEITESLDDEVEFDPGISIEPTATTESDGVKGNSE